MVLRSNLTSSGLITSQLGKASPILTGSLVCWGTSLGRLIPARSLAHACVHVPFPIELRRAGG